MAVVSANKQTYAFKKKPSKPVETVSKPTCNLSVTVGPDSDRYSNLSQNRTFNRDQKRNSRNQVSFKPGKKGKCLSPLHLRCAHFGSEAYCHKT